ncbi:MAG: TPM domain-containing protein [Candidatus Lindowbacteria bacterium]|nr:TPM domain-containing protein [Candidatus Lindowbacteria bacterium]
MKYRMTLLTRSSRIAFLFLALLMCVRLAVARGEEAPSSVQIDRPENQPPKDYSPFPNPDAGYVTDKANLLTQEQEEGIERWLWQTESRTGVEIIVVTINSMNDYPGAPNSSIEAFAQGLFNAYGIGNMPANKGVLLLVAANDRRARIGLGAGYGRPGDSTAQRIMDKKILPAFRWDNYPEGITNGVKAIMLEFAGVRVGYNWPLILVGVSIPVVGLIAFSLFKSGKRGWGWVCVGLLIVLILALLWILRQALRHAPQGRSSEWSSGGLGGFGGGFSGGGGASGSW